MECFGVAYSATLFSPFKLGFRNLFVPQGSCLIPHPELWQADSWVSRALFCVEGVCGIQGCGCGLHPGGVAVAEPCSEDPAQGSDAGDLHPPGLTG